MRYIKVLLLVLLIFFSLVFFFQNQTALSTAMTLKLNLFFVPEMTSIPLPFYFIVIVAFFVGALLAVALLLRRPSPVQAPAVPGTLAGPRQLTLCTLGFGLCLLGLFQVVNALVVCAILALFLLLTDRALLASVDYSLLGVFAAFFIFIGNLSGVEGFQSILSGALTGHVELVAVLASQVTSNVPAALLLSGFTNQWAPLIVGCNLGGLGTLIASMASLISYKEISRAYPDQRGRYFMVFTLCNVGMLALLLGLSALLGGG